MVRKQRKDEGREECGGGLGSREERRDGNAEVPNRKSNREGGVTEEERRQGKRNC